MTTPGFEPATAAGMAPQSVTLFSTPNDPTAVLDGQPLTKMIALHQRAIDLHLAVPEFSTVQEVAHVKAQHANRIADLTRHRSEGGFGQPDDAGVVVAELRRLERATAELKRVTTLKEVRADRWRIASQLERAVTDWLLSGGIPGGCVIEAVEDAPLTELLKKGETIADGVERYRHRLRELAADLHRVKSAPWPSSAAKAAAKAQIDALAEAAQPDIDRCIEHGLPVGFVTTMQIGAVRNAGVPGAAAFTETPDAFGLLCWLFRDQLLARINEQLDEIADDGEALSEQQRQEAEATITGDTLAVERSECGLIWHADAKGEVIDFRADTTAQAVLGVRIVTAPRVEAGTSVGYAYDLIASGRQR